MQLRMIPGTDDPPTIVTVEGSGELQIEVDKAATATIGFHYSSTEKVTVRLEAERGLRIRGGPGLTLSGGLAFSMLEEQITASAGVELDVSESVAIAIEQELARGRSSTSISFRIRLP